MANLIRARGWGQFKPPIGAQVDWGHPLAQGLTVCALPQSGGSPVNIVTGAPMVASTGSAAYSPYGLVIPASTQTFAGPNLPVQDQSTTRFTQRVVWLVKSVNSSNGLIGNRTGGGPGTTFQKVEPGGASGMSWDYDVNGTAVNITGGPNMFGAVGQILDAVAVKNGGTLLLYVNGKQVGTHATPASGSSNAQPWFLGSDEAGNVTNTIIHAQRWDGVALTPDQILWLRAEPYAFVAPPGPKILYFGLAAGVTTVQITDSDTLAIADGGESIAATLTDAETTSVAEAGALAAMLADSETGTVTDAGESLAVALTDAEIATFLESEALAAALTDADTVAVVDDATITVPAADDTNPWTLTLRERGHTATFTETGFTAAHRERKHTATHREKA